MATDRRRFSRHRYQAIQALGLRPRSRPTIRSRHDSASVPMRSSATKGAKRGRFRGTGATQCSFCILVDAPHPGFASGYKLLKNAVYSGKIGLIGHISKCIHRGDCGVSWNQPDKCESPVAPGQRAGAATLLQGNRKYSGTDLSFSPGSLR